MESKNEKLDQSFRDSIATIGEDGKRAWVYASKPSGKYYRYRTYLSYFLLFIFFTMPFIKWHGDPLFLFNIPTGRFIIFNVVFWAQDFFIFGLGMLIFILFVVVFTVVFGRIFCGWACPQTIFLEMVFRKIEFWIEGDANEQKRLDKMPWTADKIKKRGLKLAVFFLISFLVANTFLSYIIGMDELRNIITGPFEEHIGGLISILIFSLVFNFIFLWFREQSCIVVCPYGRLQGVLLDRNSLMVAYDYNRGETRGKFKKNEKREIGDCIDCHQCVKACPTGVDIRNGTQMECINCTACIDACDHMMENVGLPKGLIRYASENGIANKVPLKFTTRMFGYVTVLCILIGLESFLLISRTNLDVSIIRARGLLYQEQPDSINVSNIYNLKLENKTRYEMPVTLKLESLDGQIKIIGNENIVVPKEGHSQAEFFILLNKNKIRTRKTKLKVDIFSKDLKIKSVETVFFGPVK